MREIYLSSKKSCTGSIDRCARAGILEAAVRYGAGSLHNSPSAAEWSGGWWCDVKCADLFVLSFRETIVAVEGADGAWPAPLSPSPGDTRSLLLDILRPSLSRCAASPCCLG